MMVVMTALIAMAVVLVAVVVLEESVPKWPNSMGKTFHPRPSPENPEKSRTKGTSKSVGCYQQ